MANATVTQPARPAPQTDKDVARLTGVFKVLSDASRLKVLITLAAEPAGIRVGELARRLAMGQPALSHHLALMRLEGLLEYRREGKCNVYTIVPGAFEGIEAFVAVAK